MLATTRPAVARLLAVIGAAALALPVAAAAQERPRVIPTHDVVVQYSLASNQPGVPPSVVAHLSTSGRARIETADHGTVLYDLAANRARWLLPQSNIFVELPVGNSLAFALAPNPLTKFERMGRATVAGLACDTWRVTAQRGSGTACVTSDGVILRAEGGDQRGHTGSLVATDVRAQTQSAALFEPPPGSQRLDLPRGMALPSRAVP